MVLTKDLAEGALIIIDEKIFKVTEKVKMENGLFEYTAYSLHTFEWMTTIAESTEVVAEAMAVEKDLLVKEFLEDGKCLVEDEKELKMAVIPPDMSTDNLNICLLCGKTIRAVVIIWNDIYAVQSFSQLCPELNKVQ